MFERFTPEAKAVLIEAHHAAVELGSAWVTPLHVLYGCAASDGPTAAGPLRACGVDRTALRSALPRAGTTDGAEPAPIDGDALGAIGIDYERLREAVEGTFGTGALESAPDRRAAPGPASGRPRFTPDARRTLEHSVRSALAAGSKRIEGGHVLLGLLRTGSPGVLTALAGSGTTPEAVADAVRHSLRPPEQRPA